MPLYEYNCKKCGTKFETLVPNAGAKTACTACGSKNVQKQLSTFSPGVTAGSPVPCAPGGCPSSGMAGTGCGGGCPFS